MSYNLTCVNKYILFCLLIPPFLCNFPIRSCTRWPCSFHFVFMQFHVVLITGLSAGIPVSLSSLISPNNIRKRKNCSSSTYHMESLLYATTIFRIVSCYFSLLKFTEELMEEPKDPAGVGILMQSRHHPPLQRVNMTWGFLSWSCQEEPESIQRPCAHLKQHKCWCSGFTGHWQYTNINVLFTSLRKSLTKL